MDISIRKVNAEDFADVKNIVATAFETAPHADGNEAELVGHLRASAQYLKGLSFVAQVDTISVGHIMFTEVSLDGENPSSARLAALAPLSVIPPFQGKGIGSRLVIHGLAAAKDLGIDAVLVVGDPAYYGRFGFTPAQEKGITSPFPLPSEYFMVVELTTGILEGVDAVAVYSPAFSGEAC